MFIMIELYITEVITVMIRFNCETQKIPNYSKRKVFFSYKIQKAVQGQHY